MIVVLLCAALFLTLIRPVPGQAESAIADTECICQVALLQSLAQGHFDGITAVSELKTYVDTGIGTFEGVNGEMIFLDGVIYQAV